MLCPSSIVIDHYYLWVLSGATLTSFAQSTQEIDFFD